MKKRLQGLIAGVLIGTVITSGMVFAKQISETAELFYNNIKIYIDGGEIVPKDANGNTVEPFTMNGTTYLPVRAISNAFGKDVEWDGATQSVYIGKKDQTKPDNYLDRIQYSDYKEGRDDSALDIINGEIVDYNNTSYKSGLLFSLYDYTSVSEQEGAELTISYPLNSQYKKMLGKIILPKAYNLATRKNDHCFNSQTDVWFYGDGKLLYKATGITSSMPFTIELDLKGVNTLTIRLNDENNGANTNSVALTDLALYK